VSGDLGYHTARDAQQAGIGLIDIGHFGSEHLVVDVLAAFIRRRHQGLRHIGHRGSRRHGNGPISLPVKKDTRKAGMSNIAEQINILVEVQGLRRRSSSRTAGSCIE
jgi:hypothetical protein